MHLLTGGMNVLKDNEILLFDRLNQARNIDQITVVFKGLMRALEDGTDDLRSPSAITIGRTRKATRSIWTRTLRT